MKTSVSPMAARWSMASLLAAAAGAGLLIANAARTGQAWMPSYLAIWLFVLGLSLGSMALLIVHNLTAGGWGQAARPFFEAALRMFPILALLAIPLLFRLPELFPWMRAGAGLAELRGRAWYLNTAFFSVRALIYFAIWLWLAWRLRGDRPARVRGADQRPAARPELVSSVGFVLFAVTTTFAAVDWMMSLTPQWRSTEFGLLIGVGQVLSALSGAIISAALFASDADAGLRQRFHDLGKLLQALVLLWAYLAFMQFLIIWIEDLPDETGWYMLRTQTSWSSLAWFLAGAHFVLPFLVLLSRNAKRTPPVLAAVAGVLLLAGLADTFFLVVPPFRPRGFELQWNDLFALLAVGGAWLGLLLRAIRAPAAHPMRGDRHGGLGDHAGQHA